MNQTIKPFYATIEQSKLDDLRQRLSSAENEVSSWKQRYEMVSNENSLIEIYRRNQELESSIINLLKYFTSGNDIEVEKVTLTLNQIKSEVGHLFPDHKFTQ